MNFSSLSSSEKLAVYGAIAVIVGMLIASAGFFGFGLGLLALIAAIAMLVIVFLPQMSAGTELPGSKGTLMFAAGIIAAAVLVISLIQILEFIGIYLGSINGIFFLIAVVGSLLMAWAGWQQLQSEGGSFRFGTGSRASGAGGARPDASSATVTRRPDATPSSAVGSSTAVGTSTGASVPPSSSVGSSDMASEGGPTMRREEEEDPLRNP
ncbi:MAG: hypothetical protein LC744_06165 [Chloroflexi bacterium]|nr:hypothetical protein [Chloroflexota bacterium]